MRCTLTLLLLAACLGPRERPTTDVDADGIPGEADCDDEDPAVGGPRAFYPDADGDGYGDAAAAIVRACEQAAGLVTERTDCDDAHAEAHPGGHDVCGDGLDNDCDPATIDCRFEGESYLSMAGPIIVGPHAYAELGNEVAAAGDVDGDGYDDVLVGVGKANPSPNGSDPVGDGALWLIRGGDPPSTTPHAVVWGTSEEPIGRNLIASTDVDADGYSDVVVAGWRTTWLLQGPISGEQIAGQQGVEITAARHGGPVRTPDGSNGLWLLTGGRVTVESWDGDSLVPTMTVTSEAGVSPFSGTGRGDYDGDGLPELAVGAEQWSDGGILNHGGVFLFTVGDGTVEMADADAVLRGEFYHEYAGRELDAGDVNGDGYDDLLIGSAPASLEMRGYDQFVVARLVHGPIDGDASLDDVDLTISCEAPRRCSGPAPAIPGDFDGDGFEDVAIGTLIAQDETQTTHGKVWLFYGPAAGTLELTQDADAALVGDHHAYAGAALSAVGDVDADGAPDLLVGGYRYTPDTEDSSTHSIGAAWIVFGDAL